MAEAGKSISACARTCLDLFVNYMEVIQQVQSDDTWADNHMARLKIWSANLGVFAKGHASIEHRLRDASGISELILQLLEGVEANLTYLTECTAQVIETNPSAAYSNECDTTQEEESTSELQINNQESAPVTQSSLPLVNEMFPTHSICNIPASPTSSSSSFSFSSSVTKDSGEISPDLCQLTPQESMQEIETTISRLARLSFAIRQESIHQRDAKAELYIHWDKYHEIDMTALFFEYVTDVVEHRIPIAHPAIRTRIARSIARRQNRILYRRSHQSKIAYSQEGPRNQGNRPNRGGREPRKSRNRSATSSVISRLSSRHTPSLSQWNTSASDLNPQFVPESQPTPSSSSITTQSDFKNYKSVKGFPPEPKISVGAVFNCPYCSIWCPAKEAKGDEWTRHVIKDLAPFVCIFISCSKSDELFYTFKDWILHMREEHVRKIWTCAAPSCTAPEQGTIVKVFTMQESYMQHMKTVHCSKLSDAELVALSEMNLRPGPLVFDTCEICGQMPEEIKSAFQDQFSNSAQEALQQHLANHLVTLAMISIKDTWLEDSDSVSGVSDGSSIKQHSIDDFESTSTLGSFLNSPQRSDSGESESDSQILKQEQGSRSIAAFGPFIPPDRGRSDADKTKVRRFVTEWRESLVNTTKIVQMGDAFPHPNPDHLVAMAAKLQVRLYESRIEWPPGRGTHFIPANSLDSLITYDNVKNELCNLDPAKGEQELNRNTDFICSKAKKIFTILLYIDKLKSIAQILNENVCDDDLPFIRCYRDSNAEILASSGAYTLCRRSRNCHQGSNHLDCGIKALSKWFQRAIDDLDREQWLVQAPIFTRNNDGAIPYYDLHDNTILPFIDDYELREDRTVSSGYSHIWRVRIHPAHQKLHDSSYALGDIPLLAIKRLFSRDLLDFEKETEMLCALAVREHPHLIRLLATYKFKEHYHLIFPHAASHLRDYWNLTGLPHWNRETYLWTIHQLRGLASGLSTIHNFSSQTTHQMLQTPAGPPGGKPGIAEPVEKFGRHGDIKPENILWFNKPKISAGEGTLQIAGMGLGRYHRMGSRSIANRHGLSGSPTYSPPERSLGLYASRAYDIWSLACVYLEFITWLLEGGSSIYDFSSARGLTMMSSMINDDIFYTMFIDDHGRKQAKVREGVETWISRLRGNERCSKMVDDILTLVQNQMLVIDSTLRIPSDQLVHELGQILARATSDEVYLLGQNPTSFHQGIGMKEPQQGVDPPPPKWEDY